MSTWDVATVPNNDHNGAFDSSLDPSMGFQPPVVDFDFAQLQNPQMQQRMQNGIARNGSPGFQAPSYQTTSVVPSKRPHGDGYAASPREAPRSQTPQQMPLPGYNTGANGHQPPVPYQHLQQTSVTNASPSPIMQSQPFNSQGMSQRLQTASPSPFSPAATNFTSQASPAQSEYGGRIEAPQNGTHPYVQSHPYAMMQTAGVPAYTPGASVAGSGPSSYMPPGITSEQHRRMYEMRQAAMARQVQANNVNIQHRQSMSAPNTVPNSAAQMASYQQARAQQMQQAMLQSGSPEQFAHTVSKFMQQRGHAFNPVFNIAGGQLHSARIYSLVMKYGGSKKVTMGNGWPTLAASLGFHPAQFPTAAQELQSYWHSNILPYEQGLWQSYQQQRRMLSVGQPGPPHYTNDPNLVPEQTAFMRPTNLQNQNVLASVHSRQPSSLGFQAPARPGPLQRPPSQMNGLTSGVQGQMSAQVTMPVALQQQMGQPQGPPPGPEPVGYPPPGSMGSKNLSQAELKKPLVIGDDTALPKSFPISDHFTPKPYFFVHQREHTLQDESSEVYGGLALDDQVWDRNYEELSELRPRFPKVDELGIIDIRALNMSLKSGIHGEVGLALDTLVLLSTDQRCPLLAECEDLVETLIECAEEQVEILEENTPETSEMTLVNSYEDLVRGCKTENAALQDVPEFGTLDYEMDRAAERVICITTMLRNFSFYEVNHKLLSESGVVRFITTTIRYLATRNMLLRTYRNTLDFSKDIVIFLSNLSHAIDLPGKEEALCILHFLLSFAPSPLPNTDCAGEIMFSTFHPSIHRYLPPAVDSLAKILARDDPNRAFYKSIFGADSSSSPAFELLTRTFGLAIAPIPEPSRVNLATLNVRKPYLAQGLLAAEILITLIPPTENGIARSWLASHDGFASNLLQIVTLMNRQIQQPPPQHPHRPPVDPDPHAHAMISQRGISVLRRLAERAREADLSTNGMGAGRISKSRLLLEALNNPNLEMGMVRQLCSFAELEY